MERVSTLQGKRDDTKLSTLSVIGAIPSAYQQYTLQCQMTCFTELFQTQPVVWPHLHPVVHQNSLPMVNLCVRQLPVSCSRVATVCGINAFNHQVIQKVKSFVIQTNKVKEEIQIFLYRHPGSDSSSRVSYHSRRGPSSTNTEKHKGA